MRKTIVVMVCVVAGACGGGLFVRDRAEVALLLGSAAATKRIQSVEARPRGLLSQKSATAAIGFAERAATGHPQVAPVIGNGSHSAPIVTSTAFSDNDDLNNEVSDSNSLKSRQEPRNTPLSLTSEHLSQMFSVVPMCLVSDNKNRCQAALKMAQRIVSEPKREDDSWAYGAEYELQRELEAQLTADPETRNRSVPTQVVCNSYGCLIFRGGPINLAVNYAYNISKRIRGDPTIPAINNDGRWPTSYSIFQGTVDEHDFELIELRR